MTARPGHASGHPAGVAWGDVLAELVATHGTLTAVAWRLVDRATGDDVASVERALRRLRTRGQHDGGVWGRRLLREFGLPTPIEARLRWLGLYHSPFADLPVALCRDQLRLHDRPPVDESRARAWIALGLATCALRTGDLAGAGDHLARVTAADLAALPAAAIEHALATAFVASRDPARHGDPARALARAEALLADPATSLGDDDRACFAARVADHHGYVDNHAGRHAAALARYLALPAADVHPFASYRRDAGAAYATFALGDRDRARALAERAVRHAGDGGYVRLRVMGLILVGRIAGDADAFARARAIATRLGDTALLARVDRAVS